jgi:two-component system response regulator HydG
MNDKITILLVEDDEVDRELVRKALKSLNPEFAEATNGAECMELLAKQSFGIILLDYKLPDTTGLELIYKIREFAPTTPIIVITGYGNEDLVLLTKDAGVLDYIPKNKINPEFLTRTILNDILIHRTRLEKEAAELELQRHRDKNIATLSEIIRLAKDKLAEYDQETKK